RWDFDVMADGKKANECESIGEYPENVKSLAQSGFLYLREKKRPDEFFPIYEGDNFTAVLSSKDLCMVDHLDDLKKAGVDSLKIEGRMKSVYYVALVTRAYRKALDALDGKISGDEAEPFVEELYNASHRPYATGFYYGRNDADVTVSGESGSAYKLCAEICGEVSESDEEKILEKGRLLEERRKAEYDSLVPAAQKAWDERAKTNPDNYLPSVKKISGWRMFRLKALNMIDEKSELEYVTPDIAHEVLPRDSYILVNPDTGEIYRWCCDGHPCVIYTSVPLDSNSLIRGKVDEEELKTRGGR
ncbi:MAG: U32 family peptidase, partial [Treponema sp.]|nr:U32 family peptidase [Treponema sp.]